MQLLHSCFAPLVLNMKLLGVLVSAAVDQIRLRLDKWFDISHRIDGRWTPVDGRLLHELGRF